MMFYPMNLLAGGGGIPPIAWGRGGLNMALTMDNKKNKSERKTMTHKVEITDFSGHYVTVDSVEYIRWGPDCWEQRMGESSEPIHLEEKLLELEAIFQTHKMSAD
jgi:hypothetical protein